MIAEQYILQQVIGQGGTGIVHLAQDVQTDTLVVVKALRPYLTADPQHIKQFQQEATLLQQLNHPNIVHLLQAIEWQGKHYLVMTYVPGGDLRHLLQTKTGFTPKDSLSH